MRYRGGTASYLDVPTSETNFFSAEINLARARLNERLSLIQLYFALGGGWEEVLPIDCGNACLVSVRSDPLTDFFHYE